MQYPPKNNINVFPEILPLNENCLIHFVLGAEYLTPVIMPLTKQFLRIFLWSLLSASETHFLEYPSRVQGFSPPFEGNSKQVRRWEELFWKNLIHPSAPGCIKKTITGN